MASKLLRRALLVAASASAVLLAACGGGGVASQFTPSRLVTFGDGMGDLGQNGAAYTINDGTTLNWTEEVAAGYGRTLSATNNGGTAYAWGNARVNTHPDAANNAATPTVTEQVNNFLANGGGPQPGDMFLLSAGTSDLIVLGRAVSDGVMSMADAETQAKQAGTDLGTAIRSLVNAGATHVVVAGPYNMGVSLWAQQLGTTPANEFQQLTLDFNDTMLVSIVDLGADVLYVDAALYFNLVTASPSSYSLTTVNAMACNPATTPPVDPGEGIGTGTGQVNSNLCNPNTLVPGITPTQYLFADRVYPTPQGHRNFGDYALSQIRNRW